MYIISPLLSSLDQIFPCFRTIQHQTLQSQLPKSIAAAMDFHSFARRDLQDLCKKNKIPANMTNVAMANALQALQFVEGLEDFAEPRSEMASNMAEEIATPYTASRTSTRRKPVKGDSESVQPSTRARRGTRKEAASEVDEEKKEQTPSVRSTRRRAPSSSARGQAESNVKRESTVQRAYGTRRSARLVEKMAGLSLAERGRTKAISMSSELEASLVENPEESDDLSEVSKKTGADSSNLSGGDLKEGSEEKGLEGNSKMVDDSEVLSNLKVNDVREIQDDEVDVHQEIEVSLPVVQNGDANDYTEGVDDSVLLVTSNEEGSNEAMILESNQQNLDTDMLSGFHDNLDVISINTIVTASTDTFSPQEESTQIHQDQNPGVVCKNIGAVMATTEEDNTSQELEGLNEAMILESNQQNMGTDTLSGSEDTSDVISINTIVAASTETFSPQEENAQIHLDQNPEAVRENIGAVVAVAEEENTSQELDSHLANGGSLSKSSDVDVAEPEADQKESEVYSALPTEQERIETVGTEVTDDVPSEIQNLEPLLATEECSDGGDVSGDAQLSTEDEFDGKVSEESLFEYEEDYSSDAETVQEKDDGFSGSFEVPVLEEVPAFGSGEENEICVTSRADRYEIPVEIITDTNNVFADEEDLDFDDSAISSLEASAEPGFAQQENIELDMGVSGEAPEPEGKDSSQAMMNAEIPTLENAGLGADSVLGQSQNPRAARTASGADSLLWHLTPKKSAVKTSPAAKRLIQVFDENKEMIDNCSKKTPSKTPSTIHKITRLVDDNKENIANSGAKFCKSNLRVQKVSHVLDGNMENISKVGTSAEPEKKKIKKKIAAESASLRQLRKEFKEMKIWAHNNSSKEKDVTANEVANGKSDMQSVPENQLEEAVEPEARALKA